MRNRNDNDFTLAKVVDHLVRKASHEHPSRRAPRSPGQQRTNFGASLNSLERVLDCREELSPDAWALFLVPPDGLSKFGRGVFTEPNGPTHRLRSSFSTR